MTVADTFTSYSLSSAFTNLLSVEFRFIGVDGNDGFSLDNIDTSTLIVRDMKNNLLNPPLNDEGFSTNGL